MKALIVGAGVCGPVAAMALQRAGIDTTVYEAHLPTAESAGSYLTVATNGLDALRAIGADRRVLAAGFPTPEMVMFSGTGKRLGTVPLGGTLADGTISHTIRRAHLHKAVHDEATSRGLHIEFGKRLVTVNRTAQGIVARFDDGFEAVGDVLIGCDGVYSVTRRVIDPTAPAPRYVGLLNFGGYTENVAGGAPRTWHMIFGKRAFFGYVPDPAGGTVWFANVPRHPSTRAERESTTTAQWKQSLLEQFADDRGPARDLIAAGRLELAADNTHDLPTVPRWSSGPMIVIGDAAHAPTPSSGQGASLSIEDAVILARCLRESPDAPGAFAAFERHRRHRVERIVAQGARTSSSKAVGPIGRRLRDLMLPILFRYVITEKSMAWMYDHHIEWDSPIAASGT